MNNDAQHVFPDRRKLIRSLILLPAFLSAVHNGITAIATNTGSTFSLGLLFRVVAGGVGLIFALPAIIFWVLHLTGVEAHMRKSLENAPDGDGEASAEP